MMLQLGVFVEHRERDERVSVQQRPRRHQRRLRQVSLGAAHAAEGVVGIEFIVLLLFLLWFVHLGRFRHHLRGHLRHHSRGTLRRSGIRRLVILPRAGKRRPQHARRLQHPGRGFRLGRGRRRRRGARFVFRCGHVHTRRRHLHFAHVAHESNTRAALVRLRRKWSVAERLRGNVRA